MKREFVNTDVRDEELVACASAVKHDSADTGVNDTKATTCHASD